MKLWQKIAIAPAVSMMFLLALGVMSYAVLSKQSGTLEELYKERFAGYQSAAGAAQTISAVHSNVYRLFTWIQNLKPEQIAQMSSEQQKKIDEAGKAVDLFQGERATGEEKKLGAAIAARIVKYRENVKKAVELSTVDVTMGAMLMQNADSIFQELLTDFGKLVELQRAEAETGYVAAQSAFRTMLVSLAAIVVLAVLASGAIAAYMSRVIVRPLTRAKEIAHLIARGDLTPEIQSTSRDETGDLLRALGEMKAGLVTIVAQVRQGTEAISSASAEISSGNADLSQRTEEQASSLEETASSMEQLTSTVKQNAENARQANQLAAGASSVAVKGGQVVGDVVSTMSSINDSSAKIADIIGVIDGIAFQTNILALNAAVEAARAGEQGRGFAVVASEVRGLAQRSAAAAKEIKALITDSVGKVEIGTRLVDEAGKTMDEIVSAVKRVTDIMAEITAASEEQSSGIEQVNQAVTQMDEATQQNAALVEEAAAASESLQEQAQQLTRAVAAFRLRDAAVAQQERTSRRAPVIPLRENVKVENASAAQAPEGKQQGPKKRAAGAGADEWEEF